MLNLFITLPQDLLKSQKRLNEVGKSQALQAALALLEEMVWVKQAGGSGRDSHHITSVFGASNFHVLGGRPFNEFAIVLRHAFMCCVKSGV